MCAQCMGTAAVAVGAAAGFRAYAAARFGSLLGARRLRFLSAALLTGALVLASVSLG